MKKKVLVYQVKFKLKEIENKFIEIISYYHKKKFLRIRYNEPDLFPTTKSQNIEKKHSEIIKSFTEHTQ